MPTKQHTRKQILLYKKHKTRIRQHNFIRPFSTESHHRLTLWRPVLCVDSVTTIVDRTLARAISRPKNNASRIGGRDSIQAITYGSAKRNKMTYIKTQKAYMKSANAQLYVSAIFHHRNATSHHCIQCDMFMSPTLGHAPTY